MLMHNRVADRIIHKDTSNKDCHFNLKAIDKCNETTFVIILTFAHIQDRQLLDKFSFFYLRSAHDIQLRIDTKEWQLTTKVTDFSSKTRWGRIKKICMICWEKVESSREIVNVKAGNTLFYSVLVTQVTW